MVGVYYKDKSGAWKPIPPEIAVSKSWVSLGDNKLGITKGHILGVKAATSATLPVTLAVYIPEGGSIGDYRLMRLQVKANDREFPIAASLVANNEIDKSAVMITSEKIAPRVYAITLGSSVGAGEFGMLAPRPAVEGSNWKIYCLHVGD